MRIGSAVIDPPVALAPMAGVTDKAYRLLCREMGCGLTVTEMVSAKAIYYKNRGTARLMEIEEAEHPVALQLFGSDPEIMAEIAAQVAVGPWDIIDVNMGCPVPKIVKNGEGSALMRNLPLAGEIISAVVQAVDVPVTVKIRTGWDDSHRNAVEAALTAEKAGAAMVCVHGRTREQMYSPPVDRETIAAVKSALSIPVVANGSIYTAADALEMKETTG